MSQQAKIDLLDVSAMTVEQGVQRLAGYAVQLHASDLMYVSNEQSVAVQVRHLGQIRNISVLDGGLGKRHMMHIKASAGIEVSERRRPLDGRWIFEDDQGAKVDLRINTIPTLYGEDFAIRLMDRTKGVLPIEALGMHPEQQMQYTAAVDNVGGLILVTGPTGAGKSSTLYATVVRLNDGLKKINTIEDPIEYAVDGIRQSQVNHGVGLGFPELLRSVLRQAPDVIMIGEIRDPETAQTAVQAANSGMMVLATLHAPEPMAAVQSLRSLGVHQHFISTSLRCVVGQRLVRTLCPKCRATIEMAESAMAFDDVRKWLKPGEGQNLYAAVGCEACRGLGYASLTGVFEVVPMTNELRNMIAEARPSRELAHYAATAKNMRLREACLLKIARGETTSDELFRVVPSEQLLAEAA